MHCLNKYFLEFCNRIEKFTAMVKATKPADEF